MNELYAINPKSLQRKVSEVRAILKEFGLSEGRFIAQYPSDWCADVLEQFPKGTKQRSDVSYLIRRCQDALLRIDGMYRFHKDWDENVLGLQNKSRKFEAIFSETERQGIRSIMVLLEDLDYELKSGREDFVAVNPESYARVCEPLFACSEEVVLHDYLFSLRYEDLKALDIGRMNVLKRLLEAMVRLGRVRRFLLIFNRDKFGDLLSDIVEKDLNTLSVECDPKSSVELLYDFDSMALNGGSRHPRCIFSVKGGLQFDQGFQIFRTAEKNLVRWMSKNTLEPFQKRYLPKFQW